MRYYMVLQLKHEKDAEPLLEETVEIHTPEDFEKACIQIARSRAEIKHFWGQQISEMVDVFANRRDVERIERVRLEEKDASKT